MKYSLLYPCLCLLFALPAKGQWGDPITNHESYFVPGAGYGFYFPKGFDTTGHYQGAIVEYLFYNQINETDTKGPSHVRFYGKLQILTPTSRKLSNLFQYNLGADFSFERNPKRNVLIPYFGFEAGGMSCKVYGTNFIFYPLAGLRLLAFERLNVNAGALYAYPVHNFDIFRGWQAQATVNFSFW